MTTPKCVICPCEDITTTEIEDAIEAGLSDVESIKRYTGVATGACQGKICLPALRATIMRVTGKTVEEVGTMVHRPPLRPIPIGELAGEAPRE
jgi:bacterioferritin-associated ferredoxin